MRWCTITVMATICPTVTALNQHQYREQIARIAGFATHVHLDFMDGHFTPTTSPAVEDAWWPHTMQADLHVMYKDPTRHVDAIIALNPRLVIIHAEAEGDFMAFAGMLHDHDIGVGVALLPKSPVNKIEPALDMIDHVLVFSGDLGRHGGVADLSLLGKVKMLKGIKPGLEIGWDGGINADNAPKLIAGGVDVLNVGGYIQRAQNPARNYQRLQSLLH